jgi:hypothetical protein
MQVLNHLSPTPSTSSPFCFSYFAGRVWCFLPWVPQMKNLLHMPPPQLGLQVCVTTHIKLIYYDGILLTFLPVPQTEILLITPSHGAQITEESHHTWPLRYSFSNCSHSS